MPILTSGIPQPTKAGSVVMAWPPVCHTPSAPAPTPVPYPNSSGGTATKSPPPTKGGMVSGRPAPTRVPHHPTALASAPTSAVNQQQLRSRLASIHGQLMTMGGTNPARWHQLAEEYVVTAGALYLALGGR